MSGSGETEMENAKDLLVGADACKARAEVCGSKTEHLLGKAEAWWRKAKDCWHKAGAGAFMALAVMSALPGRAHAASIDQRAISFIQDGMDTVALVCFFIGGGLIAWGLLRIASTMGDGQGAQASAGMTQIGGGALAMLAAGIFSSLPTLLQS